MNATDPNLEPFRRLSHKLIYYHGAADPLIPAQNGVDYFESVVASEKSLDRTQSFYRAFLVPGLYHCSGGPGPIAFGTSGEPPAGAARRGSRHPQSARAVGGKRHRAGKGHRHQIRRQRCGQGRCLPAAAVSVSPGCDIQGHRGYERREQFQLRRAEVEEIRGSQNPRTPEPQNPRTPEPQNLRTCLRPAQPDARHGPLAFGDSRTLRNRPPKNKGSMLTATSPAV